MRQGTISWIVYGLSSSTFLFFLTGELVSDYRNHYYLLINVLFLAPAGYASVVVRKLACNLIMFIGAVPAVAFALNHWNEQDLSWVAKGSTFLDSLYCLLGLITAGVWLLTILIRYLDRRLNRNDAGAEPQSRLSN